MAASSSTYDLIEVVPRNELQVTISDEKLIRQKVENKFRVERLDVSEESDLFNRVVATSPS